MSAHDFDDGCADTGEPADLGRWLLYLEHCAVMGNWFEIGPSDCRDILELLIANDDGEVGTVLAVAKANAGIDPKG